MHAAKSCHAHVPRRSLARWIVLSLVVFGFGSSAAAQQTDRERASQILEYVRVANDAFEAERYQIAYENYLKARDIFPNEAIHYRLGQTAERLNKPFEAVAHYEDYLALEPKGEAADRIKERLPTMKAALPALLIRAANDAFDAQQFRVAYENYLKARAIIPNEAIHFRLGQTAERLNMPFEAVEHYEDYLSHEPKGDAAERIKERLPALKAALPGRLQIDSSPQGAEVFAVAGNSLERLGRTPLTVDRPRGNVTLELTFPEHASKRTTLSVEGGIRQTVRVELEELPPGQEQEPVATTTRTQPETGNEGARSTTTRPSTTGVAGAPGEKSEGSSLKAVGFTTIGIGAAVLATGGVFTYFQNDATEKVNSYDKRADGSSRTELAGLKDDANNHYRTALISYIAGGVITAGGVGILVYDGMRKSSNGRAETTPGLRLGGAATGQGAWLTISGQF
jgi:tetratricopeptide (TPR) repeat protein